MPESGPRLVAGALGVWMLVSLGAMMGLGLFSIELFFIISFIGLLITSNLFAPEDTGAVWWNRLRIIMIPLFAAFLFLAVQRVMDVLQ